MATMDFTDFDNGDTVVVLSRTRVMHLHSDILRRGSATLHAMLVSPDPDPARKSGRKAAATRSRKAFELVLVENPVSDTPETILTRVHHDAAGLVCGPPVRPAFGNENGLLMPPEVQVYQDILSVLHGRPLHIENAGNEGIRGIMSNISVLLRVANHLRCVDIISAKVEAVLLSDGGSPCSTIPQAPLAWLDLATQIKSHTIYRDALIHCVGQHHNSINASALPDNGESGSEPQTSDMRTIQRKYEELQCRVRAAVRRISQYRPADLHKGARLQPAKRNKMSYASNIFQWIALVIFREWFTEQVQRASCSAHRLREEYQLMKKLFIGGTGYLTKERDLPEIYARGYSATARGHTVVEEHLRIIKAEVRGFVKPLMQSQLKLLKVGDDFGYFVDTEVLEEDYPW